MAVEIEGLSLEEITFTIDPRELTEKQARQVLDMMHEIPERTPEQIAIAKGEFLDLWGPEE